MANKRPEIQDRIILASFLAPVAFADNMKSPLRMFAPYAYSLQVTGQDALRLPIYVQQKPVKWQLPKTMLKLGIE